MGTELVGPCVKEDNMEIPSIPPGFESLVPFTLKRMEDNQVSSYSRSSGASEAQNIHLETENDCNGSSKTIKSRRRRALIKSSESDSCSDDDSNTAQNIILRNQLPKGVIRGCEACKNCQKVAAKWHPEEARRPDLEEAPVFYPSEEEFEDTLRYISSIRHKAELYGICRIVPPPSWRPPCPLKERSIWERSKFTTRVQRIDKLQNRDSIRKILQANHEKRRKKRRCMKSGIGHGNGFQEIKTPAAVGLHEAERFGFEPGPDFTLDAFQKYADDFKAQFFRRSNSSSSSGGNYTMLEEQWQPSVEDIEGEYWRMVEKPTEEIEVLYGADLETGAFGSGFPKSSQQVASASDIKYINSGWNLNNLPRLPGSVLSFESSNISGVLVPWLYLGMCFSSFCWHVEDHHLYSLNYMHWGAPKMWYGVPGSDALKLEAAMKQHLPDLFEEQPDLLHKLVTQISPSILKAEGVPVYRCIQNPGEFVLTFPRAYHAGFNCGFNCAEAVNVAPVDWLLHGQNAIELYHEQRRQTSISHDKILLGAAREAVKANWEYNLLRKSTSNNLRWKEVCGKDGILSKALKTRVHLEWVRREYLCNSSQTLKMESSFDASRERECSVCLFDLHLSAAGCHNCSPDKYACLNHAKQLCSCSWGAKFFLFRYDISELNILVEALEGKLSAIYRWARLDLGLALSSYVSKDNTQIPVLTGKSSHTSQGMAPKEIRSLPNIVSAKKQKDPVDGSILNSTKYIESTQSSQNVKSPIVVLALEAVKAPSNFRSKKVEPAECSFSCEKENFIQAAPKNKTPSCQASQGNSLKIESSENLASEKSKGKQSFYHENKDFVLLGDDEGDEPGKEPSVEKGTSQKYTSSTLKPVFLDNSANLSSPASTITVTSPVMLEETKRSSSLECIKVEDRAEAERYIGANPLRSSHVKLSLTHRDSNNDVPRNKENLESDESNADSGPKPLRIDYEKSKSEDGLKKLDLQLISLDNTIATSSLSGHQNNLDRCYRQKGPRIAKVIRRFNCNVEPLDFGTVRAGKLWCDSQAIYPKGFRSRVSYIDVVDPSKTSYYVSEILDVGWAGPLFMVSLEQNPSEIFSHVTAARCWEMVRERVNLQIAKQHKLGRGKLPPLQPPGSLDGMDMFGFSSPEIVQAIQAMDQNRVCTEYWISRPLMQIPERSQSINCSGSSNMKSEPSTDQETSKGQPPVETILNGLFKKANSEELQTLYSLLYNKNSTDEQSLLIRLLNDEINKQPR